MTNTKYISLSNEQLTSENNRIDLNELNEMLCQVQFVVVPCKLLTDARPPMERKNSMPLPILLSFCAITLSAVHIC